MNTILTIFIFLLCGTLSSHSVHAISEGDACTDDTTCLSTSTYMECGTDNKCVCKEASITYFETVDNRCHKYFGQACEIATQQCPINGYCPPTGGTCLCNGGYTETGSHKCAHEHGSICTQDYHCDRDNFMTCVTEGSSRTCDCNKDTSTYDSTNKKCVLTLNQGCGTTPGSQACAEGSECKPSTEEGNPLQCQCNSGTSENNGECQVNFGGQCSVDLHCNLAKYLLCVDGTCACDKDQGFEDVGGGVCQANYNHDCNVETGEPTCNVNKYLACNNGQCKCRHDLTDLDGNGDCRALFEGLCSETGTPQPKCDTTQFLECVGNVCTCKGDLVGNTNGECRAPLGASCEQGEICDEVANLVCDNGESGTNKCKCSGTLQPVGGVCVAAFNEHCENGKVPCNGELFFECNSDNICQCSTELIDIGQGNCRSMFDAYCGPGLAPCDENSFHTCQDSKCACLPGLQHIGNGECRTKFGMGPCDAEEQPKCDESSFLVCNHADQDNPVCTCQDNWSATDGTCLAGAGVSCANGEPCDYRNFLECIGNDRCDCRSDLINIGGVCTSKFGDSCAAGELCHTDKWVDCVTDICTCDVDKHMIPDGNGDGCTGDFESLCDQNQPCDDRKFLECIGNVKCDCRSDLVNIDGVCTSNFGGSCAAGEPCNADKWLKCIENICTCDADDHMVDDGNGNCIGQIHAPCNQGQPCDPRQLLVCLTAEGKCGCEVGTIFDPVTQKCVRNDSDVRPGDPCQGDGDCKSDTTFMECDLEAVPFSQCRCKGNETAYFESADAKCHKFVHEICDESGGMACPLNGGCDPFEVPATCKCFETHDFHETSTKKCAKPHGDTCADSTECDRDSFVGCGGAEEGKCECQMDAWFNPTTKTCLLLADSSCNPDHNATEKPQVCAPNSFCSFIDQKCHCEDGLYQNDQRLCFLKAGEPCNPLDDDDLCDVTQFHSCDPVDAKCACAREETVVEEFAGMCRIRANAECSLNLGAQECTTHSTCVPGDSSHFCECHAGLVPNKVGKCVLTYGLPCGGAIRGTCDFEGFQSCQEGRCTCLNENQMEYEPAFEKCSLKLSSPCIPGGVIACKERSHCDLAIQKCQCNQGWTDDGQGNCVGQGQFWSLTKVIGRAR